MPLETRQIGPCFAAEADGIDLTRPLTAFLRDLVEHATQRQFVYAHAWRVNDLVMWDNRRTMHRARPFPRHEPRDMRRTTLVGDGPTIAQ